MENKGSFLYGNIHFILNWTIHTIFWSFIRIFYLINLNYSSNFAHIIHRDPFLHFVTLSPVPSIISIVLALHLHFQINANNWPLWTIFPFSWVENFWFGRGCGLFLPLLPISSRWEAGLQWWRIQWWWIIARYRYPYGRLLLWILILASKFI